MRYERTLRNEDQNTKATIRLESETAVKVRGAMLYPLSPHQVRRLRKKLDPWGVAQVNPSEIGVVGQFPLEQDCGVPGYLHHVVEKKGQIYVEVRATGGVARK